MPTPEKYRELAGHYGVGDIWMDLCTDWNVPREEVKGWAMWYYQQVVDGPAGAD